MAAIERMKVEGRVTEKKIKRILIDLEETEYMSPAVALVFASEVDRILATQKIAGAQGVRFVPVNAGDWNSAVLDHLNFLGLFRMIGAHIQVGDPHAQDEIVMMPMFGGTRFDVEKVKRLTDWLRRFAERYHFPLLYEAVVETILNTSYHAYPEKQSYRFVPILGGWWATAMVSQTDEHFEFRVLAFDQGVGIPSTLPRCDYWEQIRGVLSRVPGSGFLNDHAHMIAAAFEVSRTSVVGTDGHGQGLRDIVAPIEEVDGGRLRILSGNGGVLYNKKAGFQLVSNTSTIGGTLIEWSIPVQLAVEANEHD